MAKKKYFKETIHINGRKFLAPALLLIPALILFGVLRQVNGSGSWGFALAVVGAVLAFMGLVSFIIFRLELKTKVTSEGIEVRMRPFFPKKKKIAFEEIDSCTMVTTPPLALRQGSNMTFLMERSFTLNGRNGISITTKAGEQIFIGSNRPKKLKKAIEKAIAA